MGNIEDDLKQAWEALKEKKKTPSVEEKKTEEKIEDSEDKKEMGEVETEKKEESLEENVQETVSHFSRNTQNAQSENFFANKPSETGDFQSAERKEKNERGERAIPSYISPPKPQEEKSYSPSTPSTDTLKIERNPFQGHRDFERNLRPVKPIITGEPMPPKDEEVLKVGQFERPYDSPLRSDTLEKKYKLLK
ncbi:MAG: hypothetical protein KKE23_02190 [Nanoarchaeota archaeon]|nr:hypothetical protein [Nanoarchaeota archaeon]